MYATTITAPDGRFIPTVVITNIDGEPVKLTNRAASQEFEDDAVEIARDMMKDAYVALVVKFTERGYSAERE